MRKVYLLFLVLFGLTQINFGQIGITAVYDGPLTGGLPKGVELYVYADIADLSNYGLGSANNGGGSGGEEFTFPAVSVAAGIYLYVSYESTEFTNFFGFAPDYTSGAMSINGDDAIELFGNGTVIDLYGDINTDGSGEAWEYTDSWTASTGSSTRGISSTFTISQWEIPGPNTLDGETSNSTATTPVPIGLRVVSGDTPQPDPEPTNHATGFSAISGSSTGIDLSWTDATGAQLPAGYLIKASTVSLAAITNPIDRTPESNDTDLSDGSGAVNVIYASQAYSWSALAHSTDYYFKIYPYTNSGTDIDFKTNGTIPSDNATTDVENSLPIEENFDFTGSLTDNGWNAHSGSGANPVGTTTGLTYTGYVSSGIGNAAQINNTGEDVNKLFAAEATGSVYASAMVKINASPVDSNYFLHFDQNPTNFTYRGRVFVGNDDSGNFEFGLGFSTETAVFTSNDYSFGATYLVVLKYTFVGGVDNDIVELFIFTTGVPSTEPGSPTLGPVTNSKTGHDATNIGAISLRQFNSSQDIVVDGIRVAKDWNNAPLPVELTSFTATAMAKGVMLNWSTATEVNNYGFDIEKKSGGNWTKIGFVDGHGNSNSPNDYSFVDDSPAIGKVSYRLKQIDTDGVFEYSDVVTVTSTNLAKYELHQNHPNPFNPSTVISFSLPEVSQVKITVYNAIGEKVIELVNKQIDAGNHNVNFDGANLSTGFYFYRLETPNYSKTMKMMLIK